MNKKIVQSCFHYLKINLFYVTLERKKEREKERKEGIKSSSKKILKYKLKLNTIFLNSLYFTFLTSFMKLMIVMFVNIQNRNAGIHICNMHQKKPACNIFIMDSKLFGKTHILNKWWIQLSIPLVCFLSLWTMKPV